MTAAQFFVSTHIQRNLQVPDVRRRRTKYQKLISYFCRAISYQLRRGGVGGVDLDFCVSLLCPLVSSSVGCIAAFWTCDRKEQVDSGENWSSSSWSEIISLGELNCLGLVDHSDNDGMIWNKNGSCGVAPTKICLDLLSGRCFFEARPPLYTDCTCKNHCSDEFVSKVGSWDESHMRGINYQPLGFRETTQEVIPFSFLPCTLKLCQRYRAQIYIFLIWVTPASCAASVLQCFWPETRYSIHIESRHRSMFSCFASISLWRLNGYTRTTRSRGISCYAIGHRSTTSG